MLTHILMVTHVLKAQWDADQTNTRLLYLLPLQGAHSWDYLPSQAMTLIISWKNLVIYCILENNFGLTGSQHMQIFFVGK